MDRWAGCLAVLWLAGCGSVDPIAPPDSSGDGFGTVATEGDTDTGTAGLDTEGRGASTSERGDSTATACPAGEEGCTCLPGAACVEGLLCATELCVPPGSCEVGDVGTEGCPCTPRGTCEATLICASELCVMPVAPLDPGGARLTHSDFVESFAVD